MTVAVFVPAACVMEIRDDMTALEVGRTVLTAGRLEGCPVVVTFPEGGSDDE